ncbi:MAG: tetratricopeptide repeat protein [bacterium]|nr:tetratricopeptide repeat protein [bacterium]
MCPSAAGKRPFEPRLEIVIAVALVVLTVAVYWPVLGHDFVDCDDNIYVYDNANVRNGLSWDTLRTELTAIYSGNYHPVTMGSHLVDVELFGLDAKDHHKTNLLIHVVNVLLLFALLSRFTGAPGPSAFVAALFAVHPLNVQSVAWIAERKNLLSTLFWFAGLLLYRAYVTRPTWMRRLAVLAAFLLGLLSKSMLVTFPVVLLLVDHAIDSGRLALRRPAPVAWSRLVAEKLPMFAASLAIGLLTIFAQRGAGALQGMESYTFLVRIGTALSGSLWYVSKMFVPSGLAITYPHPLDNLDLGRAGLGALFLIAVSAVALWKRRSHPYLLFGWLGYLITVAPVIGVLQVGFQPYADRYAYVPLIGLFVAVVWAVDTWTAGRRAPRIVAAAAGLSVTLALAWGAAANTAHWKDSVALRARAVAVHPGEYIAEGNLGRALIDAGRLEEALPHFRAAAESSPELASVHVNLGNALALAGNRGEAIDAFRAAMRIEPSNPLPHFNLGRLLFDAGDLAGAIGAFAGAVEVDPAYFDARMMLAGALYRVGRRDDAIAQLVEARERTDDPRARALVDEQLSRLRGRP